MTPEHAKAWQDRTLDSRCRACGATHAASSTCNQCGSTDLEYRTHAEQRLDGATSSWCGNNLIKPAQLQAQTGPGDAEPRDVDLADDDALQTVQADGVEVSA